MTSFFRQPTDPDAPSVLHGAPFTARQVAAVWAGGTAGCALRALADRAGPDGGGLPVAILVVNLLGAFLLGLLLELLALRGDDSGVRRRLRLTLGTGLLGGFTTYSAFAVGTVRLLQADRVGTALTYLCLTVVVGPLLAWVGIATARLLGGRP